MQRPAHGVARATTPDARLAGSSADSAARWEAADLKSSAGLPQRGGPVSRGRIASNLTRGAAVEDPTVTGLAEVATFAGFARRGPTREAGPVASNHEKAPVTGGFHAVRESGAVLA